MSSIGIAIGIVITTISEDSPNYLATVGVLQVSKYDCLIFNCNIQIVMAASQENKMLASNLI